MGYYGMPAAKLPPGPRTPLDEALHQIKSMESLEIMSKLIYNAAVNPKEEKYRKIRLSNAKINSVVVQTPGCIEALLEMGWQQDSSDTDNLVIPVGKFMTMAEVRKVEDAKERVRKDQAEEAKERLRNQSRASAANSAAASLSSAIKVQS